MNDFLSVGELKRFLENLPEDMPIYYQRIEDIYFDEYGWCNDSLEVKWEENDTTEVVSAFGVYTTEIGCKKILVIHAHY